MCHEKGKGGCDAEHAVVDFDEDEEEHCVPYRKGKNDDDGGVTEAMENLKI